MKRLCLFTPYYLAEDPDRQKELDACLVANVRCAAVDRIVLMIDDGHVPPVESDKILIVRTVGRPTYAQWLDLTAQHAPDAISILANSDMHVDATIALLHEIFDAHAQAFVAISRYDLEGGEAVMHKNPHWSQDVWAIDGSVPVAADIRRNAAIPLGVPRCDNKISYIFSVYGYDVFNPCVFVKTYHRHETGIRSYDKDFDKRIMGGVAYVHPCEELTKPSRLALDVWTLRPDQVEQTKMNASIVVKERRAEPRPATRPMPSCIVAYDRGWQYPAITEQNAFTRLRSRMEGLEDRGGAAYLAFPWATFIDQKLSNRANPDAARFYEQKARALGSRLAGAGAVATVCQHIHLLKVQDVLRDVGVTDVFWSHAARGQETLPDAPEIRVHPFPLYPVQATIALDDDDDRPRPHLYSFVGARANKYYMTEARNVIVDELAADGGGFVVGNDVWHYNRIVYDFQIRRLVDRPEGLVDAAASETFRQVTADSVFALCPSGTGPNSIRLWESIALGAIPVILSDRLALPGSAALWEEAAVFCPEERESILALPTRLEAIAADPEIVGRKRQAMRRIWSLYGADSFVTDIERLMLERMGTAPRVSTAAAPSRDAAVASAASLDRGLMALTSEILLSPETAAPRLRAERDGIEAALRLAPAKQTALFERALGLRGLQHVWSEPS